MNKVLASSGNAKKGTVKDSVFGMAVRKFLMDEQAKGHDITPKLETMARLGFNVKDIIAS